MNKQQYSLSAGSVLVVASIIFFVLPAFLRLDAFIPVMLSFIYLILGFAFFFMGYPGKSR